MAKETVNEAAERLLGGEKGQFSPRTQHIPYFIQGANWMKNQTFTKDQLILFAGFVQGKQSLGEKDMSKIFDMFIKEFNIKYDSNE